MVSDTSHGTYYVKNEYLYDAAFGTIDGNAPAIVQIKYIPPANFMSVLTDNKTEKKTTVTDVIYKYIVFKINGKRRIKLQSENYYSKGKWLGSREHDISNIDSYDIVNPDTIIGMAYRKVYPQNMW